ncbi:MAG: hypothetical protein LBQ19_05420, partial [Synergistaceae bacterium]|nr:hypothetical protein [Synergistaceae bacterium]
GVRAFIEFAAALPMREWSFAPQDNSLATMAGKILPEEERIDWSAPASRIWGLVRALSPKPVAWTTVRGRRLKVIKASLRDDSSLTGEAHGELLGLTDGGVAVASGGGCLVMREVQMEGKKIQTAADWWNGLRAGRGERLI